MESSSSKITVEYHDPAGIFSLVAPDLAKHLPLRNLNWQSSSRPLRQIRTLHVDFVPDAATQALTATEVRSPRSVALNNSDEIVRSGQTPTAQAVRERRHQIPGLKTTPYLKIYALRCDDKEQYKDAERKNIRDWIKANSPGEGQPKQSHDTFDWMILHVVVPDTVAASEPRWRDSSKDADELRERSKSNAKWPGKSTRTVFDRLRADFNESSKVGPDRVAQIRLQKHAVPPDLLPTPAAAATLEESTQERENAWSDLIAKIKTLILGPFDARVRQYESDVALQESRRSLPGWNFCTFFIHKEGLAKALESIGLAEDALAIYDELTLGLETTVREMASGVAKDTATAFASFSQDIRARIRECTNTTGMLLPLADCRELIVRSNISLLDFFGYLFTRQKALILRMANASSVREQFGNTNSKHHEEDLVLLGEVCWRGINFIHNNSRILQQDLLASRLNSDASTDDDPDLVDAWIYATAGQLLAETDNALLPRYEPMKEQAFLKGSDVGITTNATATARRHASLVVRRQSSFSSSAQALKPLEATVSLHKAGDLRAVSPGNGVTSDPPGKAELLAYRSDLFGLQKAALEAVATRRGWTVKRSAFYKPGSALEDVALTGDEESSNVQNRYAGTPLPAILASLSSSEDAYHTKLELLCHEIVSCFPPASQAKTADAAMTDLAFLNTQQGEFEKAASYFKRIIPSFATNGWTHLESNILLAYAFCLRQLDNKDTFVSVALSLAQRLCERARLVTPGTRVTLLDTDDNLSSALFRDAVSMSDSLTKALDRPMKDYFAHIEVADHMFPREDGFGFYLLLSIRHLMPESLLVDEICLRLIALHDRNEDIWINAKQHKLTPGLNRIQLKSSCVAFGTYLVEQVVIKTGKIHFVHDLGPQAKLSTLLVGNEDIQLAANATDDSHQPSIFLYPPHDALQARVGLSRDIHVAKTRLVEVDIENGSYDVDTLHVKIRPTSAGLRIHLADASVETSADQLSSQQLSHANGQVSLSRVASGAKLKLKIPCSWETYKSGQKISLRLEVVSETSHGVVTYVTSSQFPTELPLDVDVNDVFHVDALYSNFTVRATDKKPLSVVGAELQQSAAYAVHTPSKIPFPMLVADQQPVKLAYKIVRVGETEQFNRHKSALALRVQYCCIDELCLAALRQCLELDLKTSDICVWSRLLVPLISERFSTLYEPNEMVMALLLGELNIKSYDHYGWHEILQLLPGYGQERAEKWLRAWHHSHPSLPLDTDALIQTTERSITIGVDVPTIDFVHNISLALDGVDGDFLSHEHKVVTLGEPVCATLRIRQTDRWSEARVYGPRADRNDKPIRLSYEVQADADSWLVGGSQRAHFDPFNDETSYESRLTLIPLRLGVLALPTVDIQVAPVVDNPDEQTLPPPSRTPSMSCESSLQNAGQTVHVVRDAEQCRVYIPDSS